MKFLKILLVNIIIFVIIFSGANLLVKYNPDAIFNFINKHNNINGKIDNSQISYNDNITEEFVAKRLEYTGESHNQFCGEERIKFGENYKKNPIIILGCSYAYGHGLQREETFPYLLSNLTKRPVYNFGTCGSEALSSLAFFYNETKEEPIKNPDYVIYIYMSDHINRYMNINTIYWNYNLIFGSNYNKYQKKISDIPLIKLILSYWELNKILNFNNEDYKQYFHNSEIYLKKVILSINKEIKTLYPNTKMIIILYNDKVARLYSPLKTKFDSEMLYYSDIWDELSKETDITIVRTKDITGFLFDKNYKIKADIADWHPNAKAWKVFTPKFAEKYIK